MFIVASNNNFFFSLILAVMFTDIDFVLASVQAQSHSIKATDSRRFFCVQYSSEIAVLSSTKSVHGRYILRCSICIVHTIVIHHTGLNHTVLYIANYEYAKTDGKSVISSTMNGNRSQNKLIYLKSERESCEKI